MFGNKYYPFERNRYYYGKLFTTSDLEAEQKYINGKRHFINKVMFGKGKVCGLNVYRISDDTLMIESGFAIDNDGREIIVDQSYIKKLTSIDGFDNIKSEEMSLTIEYDETLIQPVYAIAKNEEGKEYEYNKISENFKLRLKESLNVICDLDLEKKFIYNREIYKDENYKILIRMPTVASIKSDFKIVVIVEKLAEVKDNIGLSFIINMPGFICEDGSEKLGVEINNLNLKEDKHYIGEYWVKPNNVLTHDKVNFMIKKEDIKIIIGEQSLTANENIVFQLSVSGYEPIELIKTNVKNESLESIINNGSSNEIILANITVMHVGTNCVIQDIRVPMESKYTIETPSQKPYIDKILNYYEHNEQVVESRNSVNLVRIDDKNDDVDFRRRINTIVSSGVFEIPLGLNVKANKTILSDEIMHNLGPGDVCVNVGFEFVTKAVDKKENFVKKIIFGNPEIFKDQGITLPNIETAVQVICERGTFMVGLRFFQPTNLVSVKVRWFAFRQPDISLDILNITSKEKGIYVKQDTIKLIPNEIHFIEIGFRNMNPTAVRYEVVDKDGGEINENGVYTAPNRDGVYEIKISCINEPSIYTFAYAIVMKKDVEPK